MFKGTKFFVGAIYHPPRPIYQTADLLNNLADCLDKISLKDDAATILLAGDLNQIEDQSITSMGLTSLFDEPTHSGHKLDRIYSSRPYSVKCNVVQPTVKTSHKAVILNNFSGNTQSKAKIIRIIPFRKFTPNQNAAFLSFMKGTNWDFCFDQSLDTQSKFDGFYQKLNEILDQFYPVKNVKISSQDPKFVTPEIKLLLRKKNRLMRTGRVQAADAISEIIGHKICFNNSKFLSNVERGTRSLWQAVNGILKPCQVNQRHESIELTADELNNYFGKISCDEQYTEPIPKSTVCDSYYKSNIFSEYIIFRHLDNLRYTSPGLGR